MAQLNSRRAAAYRFCFIARLPLPWALVPQDHLSDRDRLGPDVAVHPQRSALSSTSLALRTLAADCHTKYSVVLKNRLLWLVVAAIAV
jgi:hypothetical protein